MMMFAPDSFGTAEVSPGAYFVSIRGKLGLASEPAHSNMHLNRNRNRTGRGVSDPRPNACFQGLAATLGQKHAWLIVSGATANEDLAVDAAVVVAMARQVGCEGQKVE